MSLDPDGFKSRNYDRIAGAYESIAHIYSGGLILKSKLAQLSFMPPGARILYLGTGSGEEVLAAARAGHHVTAVDLSEKMVARLRRRLKRHNLEAVTLVRDVLAMRVEDFGTFDVVCGNYFFNVFPRDEMPDVINHAASFVDDGGRLMIADMAPQRGIGGVFGAVYLYLGLTFFVLSGFASFHPIYDYRLLWRHDSFQFLTVSDHRWLPFLPALYSTFIFEKGS